MRLKDKVVIVTGAGGGIGRASAVLFAKEGGKVVVHGRRESNTKETYNEVIKHSPDSIYVLGDVRIEEDVTKMIDAAMKAFGRIDILFNCAGVGYSSPLCLGPLHEIPTDDWKEVFNINLRSMYFAIKRVIPIMKAQGGGVILNCSSINGIVGCGAESYSATKGGIIALGRALAVEYGKDNIRVNTVSPGATATGMINELLDNDRDFYEKWSNMPIHGICQPEDIANGALFLVSDESRFITGHNLVIDGGFTIS